MLASSCVTGNKDFEADFKIPWDFCSNLIGISIKSVFFSFRNSKYPIENCFPNRKNDFPIGMNDFPVGSFSKGKI